MASTDLSSNKNSKYRLIGFTLILSIVFTYAGVEYPFFDVIRHPDFIANFIINCIEIYILLWVNHYLLLRKSFSLLAAVLITFVLFGLIMMGSAYLFEWEQDDWTELYSITIPFGSVILIGLSYYHFHLRKRNEGAKEDALKDENLEDIWIQSFDGKTKLDPEKFQYAILDSGYTTVHCPPNLIKSDTSLQSLMALLEDIIPVRRLNKQVIATRSAVQSYHSKEDGRIVVKLSDDQEAIVSKNKAASIKKWINEEV